MGESTISMAIFNSYAKLPEGKVRENYFFLLFPCEFVWEIWGKTMEDPKI